MKQTPFSPAAVIRLDEPKPADATPSRFALWELGFRPFYLLASAFAALSIALWALQFSGVLGRTYLSGPIWHAHEMLFGFALAVVVGFLLTAGRNWSGRPTPSGLPLMALAALWLAGRILVLTPFGWAAAIVNAAFPLAAAFALGRALVQGGSRRNYVFVGLLVLMSAASVAVHLSQLGVAPAIGWVGVQVGLDALLLVISVLTGRVLPMFTNNGVAGARAIARPAVDAVASGSVLLLLFADLVRVDAAAVAVVAGLGAAAHLLRCALWKPWKTLRQPIVWVLHVACLWIPVHLALRALAQMGWMPASLATHALTVGVVGGLVAGMMTRTARGHTARPLRADRRDIAIYALVLAAAPVRVLLPWLAPSLTLHAVLCSALLWSAGFGLYAVSYWPVLTRSRLDGRPG
ncbi:MAG: NnrS family protein [Betaproteobacteria bacterium]